MNLSLPFRKWNEMECSIDLLNIFSSLMSNVDSYGKLSLNNTKTCWKFNSWRKCWSYDTELKESDPSKCNFSFLISIESKLENFLSFMLQIDFNMHLFACPVLSDKITILSKWFCVVLKFNFILHSKLFLVHQETTSKK